MQPVLFADDNIPFLKGVLEPYAHVEYYKGQEIEDLDLSGVDGLIIRTRTKCTAQLLGESDVSFIASATIGTDHVDTKFCFKNRILFAHALGCNASAVAQYVMTAITAIAKRRALELKGKTLGIIGCGNVGGKVAAMAPLLGLNVLVNDPPRQKWDKNGNYLELDYLLQHSDIVTLHVPLDDTTRGLAGEDFFAKMKDGASFINCSRGEVVNEKALLHNRERLGFVALDVFAGEPAVSEDIIEVADLVTPHIAGYSVEGKMKATEMVVRAAASFFNFRELSQFTVEKLPPKELDITHFSPKVIEPLQNSPSYRNGLEILPLDFCNELFYNTYPVFDMDRRLREGIKQFDTVRSSYEYRRDFSGHWLNPALRALLPEKFVEAFGFAE